MRTVEYDRNQTGFTMQFLEPVLNLGDFFTATVLVLSAASDDITFKPQLRTADLLVNIQPDHSSLWVHVHIKLAGCDHFFCTVSTAE